MSCSRKIVQGQWQLSFILPFHQSHVARWFMRVCITFLKITGFRTLPSPIYLHLCKDKERYLCYMHNLVWTLPLGVHMCRHCNLEVLTQFISPLRDFTPRMFIRIARSSHLSITGWPKAFLALRTFLLFS